jgi:hypothetical protein
MRGAGWRGAGSGGRVPDAGAGGGGGGGEWGTPIVPHPLTGATSPKARPHPTPWQPVIGHWLNRRFTPQVVDHGQPPRFTMPAKAPSFPPDGGTVPGACQPTHRGLGP